MPATTPKPTAQSTASPAQTMGRSAVIPSRRRAIAWFRGSPNPAFHRQHPETERDPDDLPEAAHEREGYAGQEAGTVLVFVAFGLTEQAGVTFALVRRVREIVWVAFGLWVLAMEGRVAAPAEPCDRPPA